MSFEIKKESSLNEIKKFHNLTDSQIKNLEEFVLFLLQENQKFNFIGKSTIDELWNRHILDSAQILRFIENKNARFADFGTGAGFPGMVLSILGLKEIHLVEKAFRKCDFLRKAKLFSQNRVFIHQSKLEELNVSEFDCITSRALASLDKLISYSTKFLKKDGFCLFLKGKNLNQELELAKKQFSFNYETYPSLTSKESNIIKISQIKTQ
ncbi:MAG: 16S rRNA (guanine(527)-N(7))-methyltransferase RsmG [Pelagibacterales bacterium]|nr:16S rRNA (guanine(527)-N(7))-methyltransferase RsmG [Pelagibacterales bacterium]